MLLRKRVGVAMLVMVVIDVAVLVVMTLMGAMVMAMSRQMKMVGLARQAAKQQPETQANHQQPAAKLEHALQILLAGRSQAAPGEHEEPGRHSDHHAGMRHRGHESQNEGMSHGAPFTNEVCRHQGFAMTRRECMNTAYSQ